MFIVKLVIFLVSFIIYFLFSYADPTRSIDRFPWIKQEDGSWVPPRAQSAHQMAQCIEKNLIATLRQQPLKKFEDNDQGSLVNLSRYSTVGSLMGNLTSNSFFIEGRIARFMYISLYRMHQRAIHGSAKTFALWISEKVLRVVRPKMKLH